MNKNDPKIDKLVDDACRKRNVYNHHYDQFDAPTYHGLGDANLNDAIIIVYSEQYGHWTVAINTDGTLTWPLKRELAALNKLRRQIARTLKEPTIPVQKDSNADLAD